MIRRHLTRAAFWLANLSWRRRRPLNPASTNVATVETRADGYSYVVLRKP